MVTKATEVCLQADTSCFRTLVSTFAAEGRMPADTTFIYHVTKWLAVVTGSLPQQRSRDGGGGISGGERCANANVGR